MKKPQLGIKNKLFEHVQKHNNIEIFLHRLVNVQWSGGGGGGEGVHVDGVSDLLLANRVL